MKFKNKKAEYKVAGGTNPIELQDAVQNPGVKVYCHHSVLDTFEVKKKNASNTNTNL